MSTLFAVFIIAGLGSLAYALAIFIGAVTLVFAGQESSKLSRFVAPHLFWRASFIGLAFVILSLVAKFYEFIL